MGKRVVKKKPKKAEKTTPFTVADAVRLAYGDMPSDDDMLFWSSPGPLPSEERAQETVRE